MQIFLSWSGERSRQIAEALRVWIPMIVQAARPWLSSHDIDKGSRWLSSLNTQLSTQKIAIVCLTAENMKSEWILFESGALSTALQSSHVCPLLLGIEPTDVTGPLSQFQATRANRGDFRALIRTISDLTDSPLETSQLDTLFDLLWPRLEVVIKEIESMPTATSAPERTPSDLLSEVLTVVRGIERRLNESQAEQPPPVADGRVLPRDLALHWRMLNERELARLDQQLQALLDERESIEEKITLEPNNIGEDSPSLTTKRELLIYRIRDLGFRRRELVQRMQDLLPRNEQTHDEAVNLSEP